MDFLLLEFFFGRRPGVGIVGLVVFEPVPEMWAVYKPESPNGATYESPGQSPGITKPEMTKP